MNFSKKFTNSMLKLANSFLNGIFKLPKANRQKLGFGIRDSIVNLMELGALNVPSLHRFVALSIFFLVYYIIIKSTLLSHFVTHLISSLTKLLANRNNYLDVLCLFILFSFQFPFIFLSVIFSIIYLSHLGS